jgi:hypothetical protein
MLNEQINKIHTPCKDCVFAKYENNTQIDCELDYISKYKNKNIEVLEAYDDNKEFYIINGKKCIGYRENKWFDQFDLKDASIEDKIKKFHKLNSLDYLLIIDLKNIDLEQLESILDQTNKLDIKPQKLTIVRYADNQKFPYEILKNLLDKYVKEYKWKIQTILDPLLVYNSILKNIVSLNANRFIVSITQHNNDIEKLIKHTDRVVHHDLDQFNIISNQNKNCMIFSRSLYAFEAFNNINLLDDEINYTII